MPNDIIRTLAVKSSATASGATSYDIGSEAGKVLYTPDFESGTTITPGTQTDVNAALNYLGEHMGGAGLVVVEFTNVSSLPAVKQNVIGIDINAILLAFELSNPSAQTADWTVTTDTNTVTVSSSASSPISGTTNIKLVFGKNKGAVIDDDSLVPDILGDFAQVETSPATYAHSVGDFIVYNNKLYKVTSAISAGGSLVVGTNITQTTVGS